MIGKVITADLQADISSIYDPTKTYISGNMAQKIIAGVPCIGAPLVSWQDVVTVSGETILRSIVGTGGRMYGVTTPTTGFARIVCGSFNSATGLWTYLGKIIVPVPYIVTTMASVHTLLDFRVDDTNTSNIQVFFTTRTTGTNATHNGGLFRVYKLDLTDFALSPQTIPFATESDQKGVYYHSDPTHLGVLNVTASGSTLAAAIGMGYKPATKELWVPNNSLTTTWQINRFDMSTAPAIVNSGSVNVTAASPCKVEWASSGLSNNDCVTPISGTLPTGLTLGATYFVRNVSGTDFEVSATFGGASINTTGSNGSAVWVRSFGITTTGWLAPTGNLQVVTGGTALLTGAVKYVNPISGHAANNGVECLLIGCSTLSVLCPISEITEGATNIPNLLSTNLLGGAGQTVTPTALNMTWSDQHDRLLFITNTSVIVAKKCINNVVEDQFGDINNTIFEGTLDPVLQFGMTAITGLDAENGWIHIVGSTVGQRGILSLNTGSDARLGVAKLITKVLDVSDIISHIGFATALNKSELTTGGKYYYRTNLTSDFSDTTTGWTLLDNSGIMSAISAAGVTHVQFMILPKYFDKLGSNPFQAIELFYAYIPLQWIDPDWIGWVGQTTQDNVSPAYTAYQLDKTLSAAIPMRFIAVDKVTKTIIAMADTDTDFAMFDKTSTGGVSWSAMTGANDYPLIKHTSGIRYKWGGAIPVDAVMTWMRKA